MKKLLIIIFLTVSCLAFDDTHVAASTSQVDVQAAIDAASDGDSVTIPAGTSTWASKIDVPEAKTLSISGAGKTNTVITSGLAASSELVDLNKSGSRLTAIGFVLPDDGYAIKVSGEGWRIDNIRVNNTSGTSRYAVYAIGESGDSSPVGLIDNCEIINGRVLVIGNLNMPSMHAIWFESLGLGTNNAVFVEDCTFTTTDFAGNCIDTNYGGRYVFRYNTVNDSTTEAHSIQFDHRGSRSWEIYENTFNRVTRSMWMPMYQRGGTGVIFNNTITGTWTDANIGLDNVRSCEDVGGDAGECDGLSNWDENTPGENGYVCRDQIGAGGDESLWEAGNLYPPQTLVPTYAWNNLIGEVAVEFKSLGVGPACAESQGHIVEDRDFYNGTPKPDYTPYTYPHPLRGGGASESVVMVLANIIVGLIAAGLLTAGVILLEV